MKNIFSHIKILILKRKKTLSQFWANSRLLLNVLKKIKNHYQIKYEINNFFQILCQIHKISKKFLKFQNKINSMV